MQRALGFRISFENPEKEGNPFGNMDATLGVKLDVLAQPLNHMGQSVSSFVRLTLTALGTTTGGQIHFSQSLGAAGKDLGDFAKRSALAVDPGVRFKAS